jgi:hypothetical protein
VDPRASLDDVEKILVPTGTRNYDPSAAQPVASRYIDYSNSAPFVQPVCDAMYVTVSFCRPHITGFSPVGSLGVRGVRQPAAKYCFASGQYPCRMRNHYYSSDIAKCALLAYCTGFTCVTDRTPVRTLTAVNVLSFVAFHVRRFPRADHTATLFLCEYIKIQWFHSLYFFHAVSASPSIPQPRELSPQCNLCSVALSYRHEKYGVR